MIPNTTRKMVSHVGWLRPGFGVVIDCDIKDDYER